MKKKAKVFMVCILTSVLTVGTAFVILAKANAPIGLNKPEECFVVQHDVVIQIGDTCNTGGEGCRSNPCDE